MTPTTDLPPATDSASESCADAMQQPGTLTLYALTDELAQLMESRAEMAENREDTAEVDQWIAAYMEQLPRKVDSVAHVLRTMEAAEEFAAKEVQRLSARRRRIASMREKLEGYVVAALEQQPKPKRGSRKLEGETATLALKGNGGVEPLDISDESLVPEEFCKYTITLDATTYWQVRDYLGNLGIQAARRELDNKAIREALSRPCWVCEGRGGACDLCGGSGKCGVPGARLLPRGAHLEIG